MPAIILIKAIGIMKAEGNNYDVIQSLSAVGLVTCVRPNLTRVRQITWQNRKKWPLKTGVRSEWDLNLLASGHVRQVAA